MKELLHLLFLAVAFVFAIAIVFGQALVEAGW